MSNTATAAPTNAQLLQKMGELLTDVNAIKTEHARLAAARDTGAVTVGAVPPSALYPGHNPNINAKSRNGPYYRMGPSALASGFAGGFQFGRLLSWARNEIRNDDAKHELHINEIMRNVTGHGRMPAFNDGTPERPNYTGQKGYCCAPLWTEAFNEKVMSNDEYYECKSMLQGGADASDPDEMAFWAKKAGQPAQSWTDQNYGGTLVPPPTFGQPIELLRNREALLNAGATVVPLGPSGRITYPRLVAPSVAAGNLENTTQTATTVQTGALNLNARKMMCNIILPNELLRYGAPATEALIRADIFKSVALILDFYLLQGNGGQTQPLGLYTMSQVSGNPYGVSTVTPQGTSNTQLAPQDAYTFIAQVEGKNGDPDREKGGWIMHPELFYAFVQTRFTPYSGAGQVGLFVNNLTRDVGDGFQKPMLAGYPVTKTVQVTNNLSSNAHTTYCIFAPWEDYLLGMFGAIEFFQTDAGLTLAQADQTLIRSLVAGDGGPRHPGVYAFPSTAITSNLVGP